MCGHRLRPDAVGRPQAADGRPGRAQPHPQRGHGRIPAAATARRSRRSRRASRPSPRRAPRAGARASGRRPSWDRAAGSSPRLSRLRPCCAPGSAALKGAGVDFAPRHNWQGWDETGALRFTDAAGEAVRPAGRDGAGARRRELAAARLGRRLGADPRGPRRRDRAAAPCQHAASTWPGRDFFRDPLRGPAAEADGAHVRRRDACVARPW